MNAQEKNAETFETYPQKSPNNFMTAVMPSSK